MVRPGCDSTPTPRPSVTYAHTAFYLSLYSVQGKGSSTSDSSTADCCRVDVFSTNLAAMVLAGSLKKIWGVGGSDAGFFFFLQIDGLIPLVICDRRLRPFPVISEA